ncbi:uncharacterized protein LOC127847873 [Dreissena polymorpha]|uniref:Mab-21-like HhH/H2TH-like domain-containing protein n=1 Tax=Dreissena polymorpha TaxID=45954 RepID=A0A9D4I5H8_DREPO|nr:uncharacterized protein LOC127847873 [Dreissena polymorpha]XP_052236047.1 uncharacterized protein LOC127847873 [Dreissena polymorpha]KAH3748929.1 hypothetical protein DPMN_183418 [Dreissena polymorpha]
MQVPEHFIELSICMSEVLDDVGAGKDTVIERRGTFLWRECMMKIANTCDGKDSECFHFGSQSEGTTIPGLESDIDFLLTSNEVVNIMKVWTDWKAGMKNLLMLRDDTTPAQQYLLQIYRRDTPEPETSLYDDHFVRKYSGQVLLSADRFKDLIDKQIENRKDVTRNGPSVSNTPNWDIVHAIHVCKPLPEIQKWIERCKGRQWPPVHLLETARVAPNFLVPAGHPDSDYKREEWRLSPNLIERMLMFSFNMTQIKCYIVLKLINKSLLSKLVGDSITSFHSKTIMFYTIERTHPSLWVEHNLMFLLWLCLNVFRKFLRLGRLPHYIIHGVNLFDGKLSKVQQRCLLEFIDSMIRSNLREVFDIDIDKIGCRLQALSILRLVNTGEIRRVCLRDSISLLLKFECVFIFLNRLFTFKYQMHSCITTIKQSIRYLLRKFVYSSTNIRLKTVALDFIKHLYALQNSMHSSYCLQLRTIIDSKVIRRFQYSFDTDVASSRLKLASILYCSGHIHAAARVLENAEKRFHSKVKAVCNCRRIDGDDDINLFNAMRSDKSVNGFSELPFAFCVNFSRQELYCTPFILLFEMNRNITAEEVAQRNSADKKWMDSAEIDACPFLHYLQYLTYGALGKRNKQLHYLRCFETYVCHGRNRNNMHHRETALNLLGHCYEMEGNFIKALCFYVMSLHYSGKNNAANWHVGRC